MLGRFLTSVCVIVLAGLLYAQAPSRPLIREAIDERRLARLPGNIRPEATAEHDRGAVPDNFPLEHMLLQLRRPPEREQALVKFIDQLHTPGSPNFHRWLSAQEFGGQYGLAAADLEAIGTWLRSHGFTLNTVYPNGTVIDFSGTAAQVRTAFHTAIHLLDADGAKHYANMSDPQIPAALSPAVAGILALHDFSPHPMKQPRGNYTFSNGAEHAVVPADLATIYNLNPLFNAGFSGQGQTIVVVEDTNVFSTADWTTYRSTFGLSTRFPSGAFNTVHPAPPSGRNNCSDPGVNGDDSEAILDAELASAAAPNATIELASCGTGSGLFIAMQNLVNSASPPAIVSISYGECEAFLGASGNAAFSAVYQQAVSEGVSVFVSSGDQAAAGCDVNVTTATHGIAVSGLASTPYNVAVGGTDFGDTATGITSSYWSSSNSSTYGSALSYIPEIPWNDSCASALVWSSFGYSAAYGSGGFCNSATATNNNAYLNNIGGSGGPSACATGVPSISGVVSGSCAGTPKPSWQSGVFGIPNDGVRDLPDLSLFGANGLWGHYYVFCWSDTAQGGTPCTGAPSTWSGAGGTSFSSPILAGVQALINQKVGGRQGNPNYVYYPLAAKEYGAAGNSSCNSSSGLGVSSTCVFYDVTQGDMDVNCTGTHNCYAPSGTQGVLSTSNTSPVMAFGTNVGWDFATGIGTINAFNLANNWTSTQTTQMVTIQTSPAGLQFSVDGGALQIAPQTLSLSQGSHTISVAATQPGAAGTQYVFVSWSDGGQASHSITVGSTAATYTASFQTQYQLTLTASPSAGGTITPASGAFYAAGTTVPLSATPATGYSFVNWTGAVANTNSLSTSIAMTAPEAVTANFALNTAHPASFLTHDIDNNGKQDVAVYYSASVGYEYSLLSTGNGSYAAVSASGINPGNGVFDTVMQADFNGDSKSDILFYSTVTGAFKVGIGDGTGNFTYAPALTITPGYNVIARGDFNHDGKADLLLYRKSDGAASVALSNGDGTFNFIGQTFSAGFTNVAVADYDGDGVSDVILYNNQTVPYNAYYLPGDGTGHFTSGSSLFFGGGYSLFPADLNGDGKSDFILYRPADGTVFVAISSGPSFTYRYLLYSPGFTSFKIGDVNGDGFPDLVLYNSVNAVGYLLLGDGAGNFPAGSSLFFGPGMDFVDLRDFNGDGKQDVILYHTADGTSFTGLSTGTGFTYTYNYFGPGRIVAQ